MRALKTAFAVALVAFVGTSLVACKGTEKKKEGEKAEAVKSGEAAPAAEKEDDGMLELTKFGLVAKGVAGAKVGDAMMGEGHMIRGPGLVVTVEKAGDTTPKDLAAVKEDSDMYTPLEWKEEKLADGWIVTFQNKGGMGTNYWVKSRRKIGEHDLTCSTTASQPEQGKNAEALCKSLAAK